MGNEVTRILIAVDQRDNFLTQEVEDLQCHHAGFGYIVFNVGGRVERVWIVLAQCKPLWNAITMCDYTDNQIAVVAGPSWHQFILIVAEVNDTLDESEFIARQQESLAVRRISRHI